jgi:16S rRNA (cytosine1407-C5)-methyltransferase
MSKSKRSAKQQIPSTPPLESALLRFRPLLSAGELKDLLEELERPLYPSLRANPLKCEPQAALDNWAERYGWQTRPVPYCPSGRWVLSSPAPISQAIEHRLGFYYIQDAASMLPVELFDFAGLESPLVLDLAASPGGKTTHLMGRTADRGLVIANDSSQERITALRIVLQNWGAASCAVTHFPGEKFGAWYPETFDRVLLDAPCSMQGLRPTEGHPMRSISEREQLALARRQAGLLESALGAVKVGGQVVYSTCTLSPEEDEGVLDALLHKFPGIFQVDSLDQRLGGKSAPGLLADGALNFDPAVRNAARLWPQIYGTAGFFAARLTKLAPLPAIPQPPPARPIDRTGFSPVGERAAAGILAELAHTYGWQGQATLEQAGLEIWQRSSTLYLMPQLYFQHFGRLPVQSLGLQLGEKTVDGFFPSHEWVARFGMHFTAGIYHLPPEHLPAWLCGEDIQGRPNGDLLPGSIVAVFTEVGQLLGRGKILTGRLKNLLPNRMTG